MRPFHRGRPATRKRDPPVARPMPSTRVCQAGWFGRRGRRYNLEMKSMKPVYVALLTALLLVAGSMTARAQAPQQTGKSDSNAKPSKSKTKSKKTDAADKTATADSSAAAKKPSTK